MFAEICIGVSHDMVIIKNLTFIPIDFLFELMIKGKVLYIDTEGTFRPERIEAIAERFTLAQEGCLDNITICRCMTHEQQLEAIVQASILFQDAGPFAMLIIDSIISHFRTEFCGRGELAEGQQTLSKHLSQIARIANEHNVAVVVINQCMVSATKKACNLSINTPYLCRLCCFLDSAMRTACLHGMMTLTAPIYLICSRKL